MSKEIGLFRKYEVKKISNLKKQIDAIVLEFDDPIARVGIKAWADEMHNQGFEKCAIDVWNKLYEKENNEYY